MYKILKYIIKILVKNWKEYIVRDNYKYISVVWEDGKETGRKVIINFPSGFMEDNHTEYEIKNIMEKLVTEKLKSYAEV